jgi:hypothetical protein
MTMTRISRLVSAVVLTAWLSAGPMRSMVPSPPSRYFVKTVPEISDSELRNLVVRLQGAIRDLPQVELRPFDNSKSVREVISNNGDEVIELEIQADLQKPTLELDWTIRGKGHHSPNPHPTGHVCLVMGISDPALQCLKFKNTDRYAADGLHMDYRCHLEGGGDACK